MSHNDITGDRIITKSPTKAYASGYDRIFGGRKASDFPNNPDGDAERAKGGMFVPDKFYPEDLHPDYGRCPACDGTGDVHRADGEWLGSCYCEALSQRQEDIESHKAMINPGLITRDFLKATE